jgi:ethanolamine ammonia-lyase small subunit
MASTDLPTGGTQGADPWAHLARHTPARIALGRAGGSARTASLLDFRLSHARARDAVYAAFDAEGVWRRLEESGIASEVLATAVADREQYLVRPDLGRILSAESRASLTAHAKAWGRPDLVIIVSDGLSATAAHRQAQPLLQVLVSALKDDGWNLCPILVVPFARVKLQDEIGSILGARQSLMLLGERPGLGSPDSLGAYFTWEPAAAKSDADRNCVSNIRPGGLPPALAARKLASLLASSARLQTSGVSLKDETGDLAIDSARRLPT